MNVTLDACARLIQGNSDFRGRQWWASVGTDPSNVETSYVKLSRVEPFRVEWRMHVT